MEIVGRDEEEEFFDWCLLIIKRAAVEDEGGVLFWFDRFWLFRGVVGVDGEVVRCWDTFDDDVNRSTWEWERENWTWVERNLDNKIDDEGTDGLVESVSSDSFEGLLGRFGV